MQNIPSENFDGKTLKCDVLVVGAGSGGISAAVSASRKGAKVLLVDKNGYVGGMTASGLPYLGYLDMHKRKTLGGFAVEYVDELVKGGAALGIRYCPKHQSVVQTRPDEVKLIAAKICKDNNVEFLLHSYAVDVVKENNIIKSVKFDCAGNRFEVEAKIFIDATGDGVIAKLAGAEYYKGTAGINLQPASVIYTIGNVNKEEFFKWIEQHPENLDCYTLEYLRERPDFTFVTLNSLWKELNPIGEWPMGIWAMIMMNRLNDTEVALNGPRIACTDATDPESITKAEIQGTNEAKAFLGTLRKYVGGFENAFISHINDEIGVRETRRIAGIKQLSVEDVVAGLVPDDSIALGSYPVDIHSSKDNTSTFTHVINPYGIPYLCLVSKSIDNLMMSGRDISVDSNAYGSTRIMGVCFAVGEAAGYAAAQCIKNCVLPKDADVNDIRKSILENDGILSIERI